jgi:hypothetical protein
MFPVGRGIALAMWYRRLGNNIQGWCNFDNRGLAIGRCGIALLDKERDTLLLLAFLRKLRYSTNLYSGMQYSRSDKVYHQLR